MTIAILYRKPGQTIARPFNRACNTDEALELIVGWFEANTPGALVNKSVFKRNVGTESPVAWSRTFTGGIVEFFAFIE